jgi:hypothetical protein
MCTGNVAETRTQANVVAQVVHSGRQSFQLEIRMILDQLELAGVFGKVRAFAEEEASHSGKARTMPTGGVGLTWI